MQTQTSDNSIPYTLINGIRRYGESRPVSETDIRVFRRTPESYLHIIRHLKTLSPSARARVLNMSVTDQDEKKCVSPELLDRLLATTGSKFNERLSDPNTIISFAEEHVQMEVKKRERLLWQKTPRGDYFCYVSAYMTPDDKTYFGMPTTEPLGTCNVIAITEDMRPQLTERTRGTGEKDDQITTYAMAGEAPPSDTLIIILYKPDEATPANVCTAYTGIIAPPLPKKSSQTEEEFLYNTDWWKKYTFIV